MVEHFLIDNIRILYKYFENWPNKMVLRMEFLWIYLISTHLLNDDEQVTQDDEPERFRESKSCHEVAWRIVPECCVA